MKAYNRVCARIDLDAVEYNIEMMRRNVREGVKMLGVVKTDGYGHGAVQIAKMLSPKEYMWGFAVATLDDLNLRSKWENRHIFILSWIQGCQDLDL